jgi:hypothetical protein
MGGGLSRPAIPPSALPGIFALRIVQTDGKTLSACRHLPHKGGERKPLALHFPFYAEDATG